MRCDGIRRLLSWARPARAAGTSPPRPVPDAAELLAVDRAIAELAALARRRRKAKAGDGPLTVHMGRFVGRALLLAALGATGARGADPPAMAVVKQNRLAKSGVTFVVEGETPVLAKVKELKALYAEYVAAASKHSAAEQLTTHLAQLDGRRTELQRNLDELNQRINEQGFLQVNSSSRPGPSFTNGARGALSPWIAQRDLVRNALGEVSQEQAALKPQATRVKDISTSAEDVKAKADACKPAVDELRPMIADVTRKYAELEAIASLKAAIGELATASRANLKLGPSEAFRSAVKAVDEAERRLYRKPSAPRPPSRRGRQKAKAAR